MNAVIEPVSAVSILVLEDDPVHRLLLEHEFQGTRYFVKSAADAAEALRLMESGSYNFQVGIFDLKVPNDAGDFPKTDAALRAIEGARRTYPSMTIITISSVFIGEDLHARLDALGLRENFSKPFSLDKLREFVDGCLP